MLDYREMPREEPNKDSFAQVVRQLPEEVRQEITQISKVKRMEILEVRLRVGQNPAYRIFHPQTAIERTVHGRKLCSKKEIDDCINKFINYSYYAYDDEMRNGYITLPGGHRVGVCGQVTAENGKARVLKSVSSVNIRRAKEYRGIAEPLVEKLVSSNGEITSTPLVSPPRCGKTTLLRDLVRALSQKGYVAGVCDERSEIAGMSGGVPAFDLGENTDILDACPKAEGMIMLLRSMAPDVIVTDEIGREEDAEAIRRILLSGTSVIATIHGNSFSELSESRIAPLIGSCGFRRIVFLRRRPSIGSIERNLRWDSKSGGWLDD